MHQIRGYEIAPSIPLVDIWAELFDLRQRIQRQNDVARGLRPDVIREPSVIGALALPNPHAEAWVQLSIRFPTQAHAPAHSVGHEGAIVGGQVWCFIAEVTGGFKRAWRVARIEGLTPSK